MTENKKTFPVTSIIYTFFILIPIYWMATISFKSRQELGSGLSFFPKEPTLNNYG